MKNAMATVRGRAASTGKRGVEQVSEGRIRLSVHISSKVQRTIFIRAQFEMVKFAFEFTVGTSKGYDFRKIIPFLRGVTFQQLVFEE